MKILLILTSILHGLVFCAHPAFSQDSEENEPPAKKEEKIKISGLFYVAYEAGELQGEELNKFFIGRSFLTVEAKVLPFLFSEDHLRW